jgi:hypothetical protein
MADDRDYAVLLRAAPQFKPPEFAVAIDNIISCVQRKCPNPSDMRDVAYRAIQRVIQNAYLDGVIAALKDGAEKR